MSTDHLREPAVETGFELTEHALAALVLHGSRTPLERWLERPMRIAAELEARGELDRETAADLRVGLGAALELFAVLELEARAATNPHGPR